MHSSPLSSLMNMMLPLHSRYRGTRLHRERQHRAAAYGQGEEGGGGGVGAVAF